MELAQCIELINANADNRALVEQMVGDTLCAMLQAFCCGTEKWGFAVVELDSNDPASEEYEERLRMRLGGLVVDALNRHPALNGMVRQSAPDIAAQVAKNILRRSRIRYNANLPLLYDPYRDGPKMPV